MRQAGRIVAEVLEGLRERVKPGVTTAALDAWAEQLIRRRGGVPSFKGYRGYPASVCISIDAEIVHGIPGRRRLREGEIVSLDVGVIYEGYQGDAAITIGVGTISPVAAQLIQVTKEALAAAIDSLPQPYREVLVLRAFYDMSYREIADIVDCPESTARSRMDYAIKELKKFYRRLGNRKLGEIS